MSADAGSGKQKQKNKIENDWLRKEQTEETNSFLQKKILMKWKAVKENQEDMTWINRKTRIEKKIYIKKHKPWHN